MDFKWAVGIPSSDNPKKKSTGLFTKLTKASLVYELLVVNTVATTEAGQIGLVTKNWANLQATF